LRDIDDRAAKLVAAACTTGGAPSPAHRVAARLRAVLEKGKSHRAVGAAMLAASAGDPALLDPCRARCRDVLEQMARLPMGFERAAILQLAVDGLLLSELLHLSPLTPDERERVVEALIGVVMTASNE
jgi:hypothetical protein